MSSTAQSPTAAASSASVISAPVALFKAAAASAAGRVSALGAAFHSGGGSKNAEALQAGEAPTAQRASVQAVACARPRSVHVVADEPGDDQFMEVGNSRYRILQGGAIPDPGSYREGKLLCAMS